MQCLSRKKDEEFHQFFVLFLSVGTISIKFKTVLKSTALFDFFFIYKQNSRLLNGYLSEIFTAFR